VSGATLKHGSITRSQTVTSKRSIEAVERERDSRAQSVRAGVESYHRFCARGKMDQAVGQHRAVVIAVRRWVEWERALSS